LEKYYNPCFRYTPYCRFRPLLTAVDEEDRRAIKIIAKRHPERFTRDEDEGVLGYGIIDNHNHTMVMDYEATALDLILMKDNAMLLLLLINERILLAEPDVLAHFFKDCGAKACYASAVSMSGWEARHSVIELLLTYACTDCGEISHRSAISLLHIWKSVYNSSACNCVKNTFLSEEEKIALRNTNLLGEPAMNCDSSGLWMELHMKMVLDILRHGLLHDHVNFTTQTIYIDHLYIKLVNMTHMALSRPSFASLAVRCSVQLIITLTQLWYERGVVSSDVTTTYVTPVRCLNAAASPPIQPRELHNALSRYVAVRLAYAPERITETFVRNLGNNILAGKLAVDLTTPDALLDIASMISCPLLDKCRLSLQTLKSDLRRLCQVEPEECSKYAYQGILAYASLGIGPRSLKELCRIRIHEVFPGSHGYKVAMIRTLDIPVDLHQYLTFDVKPL
jgi:hypothetical protein